LAIIVDLKDVEWIGATRRAVWNIGSKIKM
jgi:hypothetical protein